MAWCPEFPREMHFRRRLEGVGKDGSTSSCEKTAIGQLVKGIHMIGQKGAVTKTTTKMQSACGAKLK